MSILFGYTQIMDDLFNALNWVATGSIMALDGLESGRMLGKLTLLSVCVLL